MSEVTAMSLATVVLANPAARIAVTAWITVATTATLKQTK